MKNIAIAPSLSPSLARSPSGDAVGYGVPTRRLWVAWEEVRRPGWLARPEPASPRCHGAAPSGGRTTARLRGSSYHCDEEPADRAAALHQYRRILNYTIDNPGPYPAGLCYPDSRYLATTPGYAERVA